MYLLIDIVTVIAIDFAIGHSIAYYGWILFLSNEGILFRYNRKSFFQKLSNENYFIASYFIFIFNI